MQPSHAAAGRIRCRSVKAFNGMPRPKKESLSKAVNPGTKRGNPEFVSSSFYVPKKTNIRFDRSILTLKANGFDVDRSDILSALMELFNKQVDAVEAKGDENGMDLEGILDKAKDGVLEVTADLSMLKLLMLESLAELKLQKKEHDETLAIAIDKLQKEASASNQEAPVDINTNSSNREIAKLKSTYESVIEQMLKFVPDNEDRRIIEEILGSLKE